MASQHSGTTHPRDDKSRERQHGTQPDQKNDQQEDSSSGGKGDTGNFANDPERARKSGRKGGKS